MLITVLISSMLIGVIITKKENMEKTKKNAVRRMNKKYGGWKHVYTNSEAKRD
jgi:hypothetical protein